MLDNDTHKWFDYNRNWHRTYGPFSTPDWRGASANYYDFKDASAIAIICGNDLEDKQYVIALFESKASGKIPHEVILMDVETRVLQRAGRGNSNLRAAWLKFCSLVGEAAYQGYLIDGMSNYFHYNSKTGESKWAKFDDKNIRFIPYSS